MYKININTTKRYEKEIELLSTESKGNTLIDSITGDIDIISEMEILLKKHNIPIAQIEQVEPNCGPGSFTGIKIGIAIANIGNWVLQGKKAKKYTANYGAEPNISSPFQKNPNPC